MPRGIPALNPAFDWETFAFRTRRVVRRHAWTSLSDTFFYEAPNEESDELQVFGYTDRLTYAPGEEVAFHIWTTAKSCAIEIVRDGARPDIIARWDGVRGGRHPTPADAYARGCGWPVAHRWRVPPDARSGGHLVRLVATDDRGQEREHHYFFAIQPKGVTRADRRLLLIAATGTWTAYNDWGGANHYQGIAGAERAWPSPELSLERPFSRGFFRLPEGAPRSALEIQVRPGGIARYPNRDFAFAQGYARFYASAGWAQYDRLFLAWAEREGFAVDVITQHDLHFRPHLLDGYACVAVVGHDEYWSWEMRDAIDAYVDDGGHVARFGANYMWQIRLEDDGRRQVCHKYVAHTSDPLRTENDRRRLTSTWEDPLVGRPGASTMGLNALGGIYSRIGLMTPRGSAGFTVYRPDHWAFAGTDLYYGDVFGSEAGILGYEVDAVDYTFKDGLPEPTHSDGAPANLRILAMAPASNAEGDRGHYGSAPGIGDTDALYKAMILYGEATPEALARAARGAGMVATFSRGKGEVFNGASCEWVMGLKLGCAMTSRITRNVLDRYLA